MKPKKSKYPQIEGLRITDIAAEGKSLGKYNDMVVFVPHTVPGDVVNIQVNNKRRRFMEGYVLDFVEYSPFGRSLFASITASAGDASGRRCRTRCNWSTSKNR